MIGLLYHISIRSTYNIYDSTSNNEYIVTPIEIIVRNCPINQKSNDIVIEYFKEFCLLRMILIIWCLFGNVIIYRHC